MAKLTVTFQHTGHFWNDLGVIALWRWLVENAPEVRKRSDRNYVAVFESIECVLCLDQLEVTGDRNASHQVLRDAVKALQKQYCGPSSTGRIWWQGPSRMLFPGAKPEDLQPYDELAKGKQWRTPRRCDVCGGETLPVRLVRTAYNPFLVNLEKMSGFYSELRGGYQICQSCAFAAPFALTQAWYSWGDQFLSLTLLWPVGADLLAIDRFLRQTSDLHIGDDVGRNYQRAFSYANGPTACFLDLICSLWNISRTRVSGDALVMALAGVQFHAMQLSKPTKTSNVISVDRYEIIPDPAGVLRLVQRSDRTSKQGKVWNMLISVLSNMPVRRRGPDGKIQADTRLLNQIADAIVARAPIERVLEARIYEALNQLQTDAALLEHFNVFAFRLFVPIYFKEVKDMTTDLLPALQSVGGTLGELVKITDDRSVLYNLRNSRNVDDLLEVLSRVVVRHADAFVEGEPELWRNRMHELAESIDGSNWRRVRSLLGLYAGLKFIELSRKEQGKEPASSKS